MPKLKRKSDTDLLSSIDFKLDELCTTQAVYAEIVKRHELDINGKDNESGMKGEIKILNLKASEVKGWAIGASAILTTVWAVVAHFLGRNK